MDTHAPAAAHGQGTMKLTRKGRRWERKKAARSKKKKAEEPEALEKAAEEEKLALQEALEEEEMAQQLWELQLRQVEERAAWEEKRAAEQSEWEEKRAAEQSEWEEKRAAVVRLVKGKARSVKEKAAEARPVKGKAALGVEQPKPPSVSGKVCIVCRCLSDTDDSYNIYILDLSREFHADRRLVPNLRLDCPTYLAQAFCVLGSTLFLVEGSPNEKSFFCFDLSSLDYDSEVVSLWLEIPPNGGEGSKVVCGKERRASRPLSPLSQMNYPKRYPAAVPTPDGKKILVFSTLLNYNIRKHTHAISDDDNENKIELYDPITDSWEILPGIPLDNCYVVFDIQSYTFIDNSTFLLQAEIGDFTLDLDTKKVSESSFDIRIRRCSFLQAKDNIVLTTMGAYDMKRKDPMSHFFSFPLSSRDEEEEPLKRSTSTSVITLLDDGGVEECVRFCVVEVLLRKGTRLPSMFLDVFSIDLVKYRDDKEKKGDDANLEACKLRTFKFIPHEQRCKEFLTIKLISM